MSRQSISDKKLAALEKEFRPLLISCLQESSNGRWGLFGQNDSIELVKYYQWEGGQRLKDIAQEIQKLRAEFGQPNPLVERFLHYCSQRGANVLGEP